MSQRQPCNGVAMGPSCLQRWPTPMVDRILDLHGSSIFAVHYGILYTCTCILSFLHMLSQQLHVSSKEHYGLGLRIFIGLKYLNKALCVYTHVLYNPTQYLLHMYITTCEITYRFVSF